MAGNKFMLWICVIYNIYILLFGYFYSHAVFLTRTNYNMHYQILALDVTIMFQTFSVELTVEPNPAKQDNG